MKSHRIIEITNQVMNAIDELTMSGKINERYDVKLEFPMEIKMEILSGLELHIVIHPLYNIRDDYMPILISRIKLYPLDNPSNCLMSKNVSTTFGENIFSRLKTGVRNALIEQFEYLGKKKGILPNE